MDQVLLGYGRFMVREIFVYSYHLAGGDVEFHLIYILVSMYVEETSSLQPPHAHEMNESTIPNLNPNSFLIV